MSGVGPTVSLSQQQDSSPEVSPTVTLHSGMSEHSVMAPALAASFLGPPSPESSVNSHSLPASTLPSPLSGLFSGDVMHQQQVMMSQAPLSLALSASSALWPRDLAAAHLPAPGQVPGAC